MSKICKLKLKHTTLKLVVSVLLFSLLLALLPHCILAETKYEITESRLLQLINNLEQAKMISEQQSKLINDLKQVSQEQKVLIQSQANLIAESAQVIRELKQDSTISKELLEKAEDSLVEALKSFEIFKKVADKRIRSLTIQRNLLGLAFILSLLI